MSLTNDKTITGLKKTITTSNKKGRNINVRQSNYKHLIHFGLILCQIRLTSSAGMWSEEQDSWKTNLLISTPICGAKKKNKTKKNKQKKKKNRAKLPAIREVGLLHLLPYGTFSSAERVSLE